MRAATSDGLATQLSSFVGRTKEVAELSGLLRGTRLLTLTGTVGVGKTRLAVQLARKEQHGGRREIVIVELASVVSPTAVRRRVTDALGGLPDATGRSVRHRLLVLDNCEHVLDECRALVSELLDRDPALRVVVTSRERLGMAEEHAHQVPSLTLADRADPSTAHLQSEAARLFVDRARAVVPDFALTRENAAGVSSICARLDGIPLAIELAAQLVRTLSLREIHDLLADPLSLLTDGWRTADPRHQSWRRAVEWSYESLDPAQRSLFTRLAALPGGFRSDTAAAVCADDDIPAHEIPRLLAELAAKSLILPHSEDSDGAPGVARFRIPEPIRCFAHERLVAQGEDSRTRDRLADWLTELARTLRLRGLPPLRTLGRVGEEQDNFRYLLQRCDGSASERRLLWLRALCLADVRRDSTAASRKVLRRALESTTEQSEYLSIVLEGAAVLAADEGDRTEALRLAEKAVSVERRAGRGPLLGRLLLRLSLFERAAGDSRAALGHLLESLRIARRTGDVTMTAVCLVDLAAHLVVGGDLRRAERVLAASMPAVRDDASPEWLASALHTAGVLALELNDPRAAEAYFAESLHNLPPDSATAAASVEGVALAAVRTFRFQWGLTLIAAAERTNGSADQWWRERVAAARAAAVRALSGRADAAVESGRAMRRGEAVASALGRPSPKTAPDADRDLLSPREWEVTELVVEGLTNRQIAARLHFSVRTVETYIHSIRTTLGLRSRAQIAVWGARTHH